MREIDITDPNPPAWLKNSPERILLLVVRGTSDNWGAFEILRGSSWEEGVQVIPADALSEALHGRILPLQRILGRDPRASARRVTTEQGECVLKDGCIGWDPKACRPGGRGKKKTDLCPPDCWEPPIDGGDPKILEAFRRIALAWREGRHTVVVEGEGFNLFG